MAIGTTEAAWRNLEVTTLNSYRLAIEQGISYLLAGRCQDSLKGRAGYIHLLSPCLLFQTRQVFETYRFRLLYSEADFFKSP
jgi:hypothetical protein